MLISEPCRDTHRVKQIQQHRVSIIKPYLPCYHDRPTGHVSCVSPCRYVSCHRNHFLQLCHQADSNIILSLALDCSCHGPTCLSLHPLVDQLGRQHHAKLLFLAVLHQLTRCLGACCDGTLLISEPCRDPHRVKQIQQHSIHIVTFLSCHHNRTGTYAKAIRPSQHV